MINAAIPSHEVYTALEAGRYLRLDADHDDDEEAIVRAVQHLVSKHGLRPVRGCGKSNRFTLTELRRWVEHQTAATESDGRR